MYQKFASVFADRNFKVTLDELTDNAKALQVARADPLAYLRLKGVEIPQGVEVELATSARGWNLGLCVGAIVGQTLAVCCAGYSSTKGFFAICDSVPFPEPPTTA